MESIYDDNGGVADNSTFKYMFNDALMIGNG